VGAQRRGLFGQERENEANKRRKREEKLTQGRKQQKKIRTGWGVVRFLYLIALACMQDIGKQ